MGSSQSLFSTREVARIFGLTESRVRYWAQTGLVNPTGRRGGRRLYSFRDLVVLRAVRELLDQGVPLQRVRRNLSALRDALPEVTEPLAALRVRSDGDRLVVEHREGDFEPLTGQLVLDFSIGEVDSRATAVLALPVPEEDDRGRPPGPQREPAPVIRTTEPQQAPDDDKRPTTAYGWFQRGCALDESPAQDAARRAAEAYHRAIELDPGLAAAHTNLGNLYYREGDRARALSMYQQACLLEPDQPEAIYNLANLLEEEGDLEGAAQEYRQVIRVAPQFRDAHFNLALTLEKLDLPDEAARHWERYLRLAAREGVDPEEQEWVDAARGRLDALREEQR